MPSANWSVSYGVVAMAKRTSPAGDRYTSFSTEFGRDGRAEGQESIIESQAEIRLPTRIRNPQPLLLI